PLPPQMEAWPWSSGQELGVFSPFLGKCRPLPRRCCQSCTPRSWGGWEGLLVLGQLCPVSLPRYRGWLVRRVCALLAVWGWKVPAD
ncbi:GPAT2 acyltransferase, partial [Galbula dea]|nr:GPAT2 acyltransferase [Galbula dea]